METEMTFEASKFKLLGIVDEVTVCDCCGKKNLARTVALETEGGETVYYGTTCAALALMGRRCRKNGEVIWARAVMIQRCKDVLANVLAALKAGDCPKKAAGSRFTVSHGFYSDTGNKMPLRIYFEGWCVPGVEIPASA